MSGVETSVLARAKGKFALIKGDTLVGTFDSQLEAIRAGYDEFGNESFLVKQVTAVDIPMNFTSFNIGL